jgi:hypothetical protein
MNCFTFLRVIKYYEAVIYDTRNEDAWIQSDSAVGLAVMP